MADKNVEIRFDTQADTKGAKEAEKAIDAVADSAEKAGGELQLPEAQQGAKSLAQMETELRRLEKELRNVPVGGKAFTDLAGRIKIARKEMQDAEIVVRKLGGTIGRRGNAGLAIQEFARGAEDAQYGLRGIQNNIPGLVAALGGGPGLAGVISLVAVGGTLLWELMSKGAEKAKSPLDDYAKRMEDLDNILKEMNEEALANVVDSGKSAFDKLQKGFEARDFQARVAAGGDELEKIRIEGEARVAIARERFELLKIETDLARASGEEAVSLANQRRESMARILALEEGVTKQLREQELSVLRRKVAEAEAKVADTELPLVGAQSRVNGVQADFDEAQKAGKDARDLRIRIANQLGDQLVDLKAERASLREVFRKSSDLTKLNVKKQIDAVNEDIDFREKRISELSTAPKGEAEAIKRGEELAKQLAAANEDLKRFTDAQESASSALRDATLALTEASNKQAAQVETESALKQTKQSEVEFRQREESEQKLREAGQQAGQDIASQLEQIIASIGDAASNPNVQGAVARAREILKDGLQSGEDAELTALANTIVSQSRGNGEAQRAAFQSFQTTLQTQNSILQGIITTQQQIQSDTNKLKQQQGRINY